MKLIKYGFLLFFFIFSLFLITPQASAQAGQVWETLVGGDPGNTGDEGASAGSFPFLCQYGSVNTAGSLRSWAYWDYSGCSISTKGCNPTSTAMIMRYFGDTSRTPTSVSRSTGNVSCDTTSYSEMQNVILPWLRSRGYTTTGNLTPNLSYNVPLQILKNYIDRGYILHAGAPVRVACSTGLCGFVGHAFVIVDVNPSSQSVTAIDPTWCRPPFDGGRRTLRNVKSRYGDVGCVDGYCGWFYIIAVKKN